MKVLAVIPARYHSTRLDKKLLRNISGISMIERVFRNVSESKLIDHIIIATDHEDIKVHCQSFGAEVVMTDVKHQSGTDRIAEVAHNKSDFDIVINIQGDEPLIHSEHIRDVLENFKQEEVQISTLAQEINHDQDFNNPNVVKLVKSVKNKVLYFSRSAIPFQRDKEGSFTPLKHIGVYAYRRDCLLELSMLPVSNLESIEKLEQLRWMENGYDVYAQLSPRPLIGVDTEEDLLKVEAYLQKGSIKKEGE